MLLVICLPFLAHTQKADPPMVVEQTMMIKYPDAKKVKWEQEGDNAWEVNFVWEGTKYGVAYDNDGNRTVTERQLTNSEIPEKFITALNKEYPGYKIDEAWWIESEKGIFYEFELKGKSGEVEVLMNSNCAVVQEDEHGDEADHDHGEDADHDHD